MALILGPFILFSDFSPFTNVNPALSGRTNIYFMFNRTINDSGLVNETESYLIYEN